MKGWEAREEDAREHMKYSYKAGKSSVKNFFNINSVSGENLLEIDIIGANRQLINLLNGRQKNITKTRTGKETY